MSKNLNSLNTGKCVKENLNKGKCQVAGWCPLEQDNDNNRMFIGKNDLSDIENITIFIKSSVKFFKFNFSE